MAYIFSILFMPVIHGDVVQLVLTETAFHCVNGQDVFYPFLANGQSDCLQLFFCYKSTVTYVEFQNPPEF